MATIGYALRQAFMPKRDHDCGGGGLRLHRLIIVSLAAVLGIAVAIAVSVSLTIVFPGDSGRPPLCRDWRIQVLPPVNLSVDNDSGSYHGAFYLTDEEAADYYWMVVFLPSAIVFLVSVVYLLAGMVVAYSAPTQHPCLKVVENNYCASKRGGVGCLAILNVVFAVLFGLMALFLGSSLLTLGSACSKPLFWCYEIASWGLVILYGCTAFFLRRQTVLVADEGDLEMSESVIQVTPEMQRRVHEGFKSWMGSSLLSSDEENGPDEDDDYLDDGRQILLPNSNHII